jgi:hypothetical protein
MKTVQADKHTDKTKTTGVVRMGREVSSNKASGCDSEHDSKCAENKQKQEIREDKASSLV